MKEDINIVLLKVTLLKEILQQLFLRTIRLKLKPGFHIIAPIARVAPIAPNGVQTIRATIRELNSNAKLTSDRDRPDRTLLYPIDGVKFMCDHMETIRGDWSDW